VNQVFKSLFSYLILSLVLSFGLAQQHYNHLEINGDLEDDIGPFYFINYGNSSDAYAKADLFAEALGLSYSAEPALLRLSNASTELRFLLTRNVESGLEKRIDALVVNGFARSSPSSIWIDNQVYVAINPVVEALGYESDFDTTERILWIESAAVARPSTPVTSSTPATSTPTPLIAANAAYLAVPRVGLQENGSSRVVLDLPPGSRYSILVAEKQLIIQFLDADVAAFKREVNDDNIATIRYALVNEKPALVIDTQFDILANGQGFKRGALAASASNPNERLFIDFSPELQGTEVSQAVELNITEITRSTNSTIIPSENKKIVVIDAGHGGHDPGAVSRFGREEDVVLNVSLRLRDLLERSGVQVIMTRDNDFFLELEDRANFANTDANLFVSVHANSFPQNDQANGIETYVFGEPLEDGLLSKAIQENGGGSAGRALTEQAKDFANSIAGQIYRENQLIYSQGLAESGATDRGVKKNYFWVLRRARSPAVLVELGFLTNPTEGQNLQDEAYQSLLADSLAKGILDFLNNGGLNASSQP